MILNTFVKYASQYTARVNTAGERHLTTSNHSRGLAATGMRKNSTVAGAPSNGGANIKPTFSPEFFAIVGFGLTLATIGLSTIALQFSFHNELKSDFKGDINRLSGDFKGDINRLSGDINRVSGDLKSDLKGDINNLKGDIQQSSIMLSNVLESKMDGQDRKMDGQDRKMDGQDRKMDAHKEAKPP